MPTRLPEDAVLFIRRYHRAGYRVTTIAGTLDLDGPHAALERGRPTLPFPHLVSC